MIIIKLQGGLGNQMFQYAIGRSLAVKHAVPLYLDHSFLERNPSNHGCFTTRKFELGVFNIKANKLSTSSIDDIYDANPDITFKVYNEKPVPYDPSLKKIKPNLYMIGYWQSHLYFDNISAILREDFRFKESDIFQRNQQIVDLLVNSNSVAIHIRRGDYLGNPFLCLCTMNYYRRAIDRLLASQPDAAFFVFCEDIAWAKENLKYRNILFTLVSTPDNPGWFDMYLMSICSHIIIANSTFSWWAAWLNNKPGHNVIAPSKWFYQKGEDRSLNHLYLPTWDIIQSDV